MKIIRRNKDEAFGNDLVLYMEKPVFGKYVITLIDFNLYTWKSLFEVFKLLWNCFTTSFYITLVCWFIRWLKFSVSETLMVFLIVVLFIPFLQFKGK